MTRPDVNDRSWFGPVYGAELEDLVEALQDSERLARMLKDLLSHHMDRAEFMYRLQKLAEETFNEKPECEYYADHKEGA